MIVFFQLNRLIKSTKTRKNLMNLNDLPSWRCLEPMYLGASSVITPEQLPQALNSSVNELELSVRAANCINKSRLCEIWKICVLSDRDLLVIDGMGKGTLAEIRERCWSIRGYGREFERQLSYEFWRWSVETGWQHDLFSTQRLLLVSLLLAWPSMEQTVKKIQMASNTP